MLKIRKITRYLFVAALLAVCAGQVWSQTIFTEDFEGGTGLEGWGLSQDPFGATSFNLSYADNGPSLPGEECAMLYSMGPPAGPANFYALYYPLIDLVVSGQTGSYTQLQLTYDVWANWSANFYWNAKVVYTDATEEDIILTPNHGITSNSWHTETYVYDLDPLNHGKVVSKIQNIKINWSNVDGVAGKSTRMDNVILRAVPVAGPDNCDEVLNAGYSIDSDFNNDCFVDFADFAHIAGIWLDCMVPGDPDCAEPWVE